MPAIFRARGALPQWIGERLLRLFLRLHAKRLHRLIQLTAQRLQLDALRAALADALQVVATQLVNALAVVTNLADGAALVGRCLGDARPGSS